MIKAVCIVRGGILQEIHSNEDIEIEVLDLDNDNITDEEIKERIKDLKLIY